ncbi:hypothetical protein SEA_PAVLO_82 [Microbacterium phage Pavlo]|nr:hypothetical protein SEA_PAVLO_82 [Microbacterium phage Pavlo]
MLEGHSCWEDCDEGPHGCICGNDCEPPERHPIRQRATVDFMGQPALNRWFTHNARVEP